jgi:hypothetical protein
MAAGPKTPSLYSRMQDAYIPHSTYHVCKFKGLRYRSGIFAPDCIE